MSFARDQLLPGERVVLERRQSLVVLLRPVLLNLAAAAILGVLAYRVAGWLLAFLLAPAAVLAWEVLVRRRREYVITNRRVVKQEGIFSVHSFDAPLDKINNVFHEQDLVGRLFGFGSVGLETASEQGTTVFDHLPDPVGFKSAIVHEREAYLALPRDAARAAAASQGIPKLLDDLAALRDRKVITTEEFEQKKRDLLEKL